jgi:hypothetical protein
LLSKKVLDRVPSVDGVPVDYWVFAKNGGPQAVQWDEAWRHTERLLDRLRASVERDGARLVVSIATLRERVYPDSWTAILGTYPAMQGIEWDLGRPEARVEEWCRAREVPCVPLTPVFLARGSAPAALGLRWTLTEAGHALAAYAGGRLARAEVIMSKRPTIVQQTGGGRARGNPCAASPLDDGRRLRSHKNSTCCTLGTRSSGGAPNGVAKV